MKWTPSKIAELRKLAPTGCGSAVIAWRLGVTVKAVWMKAMRLGVSITPRRSDPSEPQEPDEYVRARWSKLIGPMREQLRADIGSM